jgi:signal transduction histidine kinase/ActR/RegA family two-component response regulator
MMNAKKYFPVAILAPLVLGGLCIYGYKSGWYGMEIGAGVLILTMMLVLGLLSGRYARQLRTMEEAFKKQNETLEKVQAVLKASNDDLELKIRERVTELGSARAQVEQLQKLDAVGRLAGGIAHDFNNVLGAIQMYCDLILRKIAHAESVQNGVSQIEKATARGAALTRQLLIFSHKKIVETQALQLNDLLHEQFKMLNRLIGENIVVTFKLSDQIPLIEADPGQIEQVILNLAINARDAMPDGGKLIIETKYEELSEEFTSNHLSSKLGPHVLLSITDTGCGMEPQVKSRIFEPFFTTKPVGKGAGLGLSTVYGIVKSLEGTIWVYSEPGKGTVFRIYFPAAEISSMETLEPVPVQELNGIETILVVEDETLLRELYAETLRQHGYHTLLAANGRLALEILEKDGARIDLVMTDMVMPELGGEKLIEHLLAANPSARVLCMSGYPGENSNLYAFDAKNVGYLQKPFNTKQLLTKVRELLLSKSSSKVS